MIRTVTCLVVECDDCGTVNYDDDGSGTPHYNTIEEARKYLDDWTFTDRQVCPGCATKVLCEATGHDWGEWLACRWTNPQHPLREHVCEERRYCDRHHCGVVERRIQAVPSEHEVAA